MLGAPFQQQGNTVMFTANTSGNLPTPVQASASNSAGPLQYLITNVGSNNVWVGYGKTSETATANAVIPTGGGASGAWSIPIPPGGQMTITVPPNAFFTGITAAGTSAVHVTPGEGI